MAELNREHDVFGNDAKESLKLPKSVVIGEAGGSWMSIGPSFPPAMSGFMRLRNFVRSFSTPLPSSRFFSWVISLGSLAENKKSSGVYLAQPITSPLLGYA